uniref:Translocon-associated protein subunit alpha n=2 Tax=Hemiselmis andersenii TaxID=464988 RepID=A0A7S1DQC5_HEMAN|mmetsp:Transcript_21792/g.53031  ORF Transcript_21792/g.53031 Transcript_21792/m.53031 type:complete len:245 (+) Transcript_21792:1-735(+)
MSRKLVLSLLLLGLLVVAGADDAAEEGGEEAADAGDATESGPLLPSEFAQTITLFPDFPDKKFILGELIDVLCGFTNVGDKSFNITQMKGSLHNAMDYKTIINYTEANPFAEIKKDEHGTMSYKFFADPNLDPKEYQLTLSIDYIDADRDEYRTVYFNNTIEFVESQSTLGSRAFFGYFLFAAFVGVVCFFGYKAYQKYASKKTRRTGGEASKPSAGGASEWLQDVNVPGAPRRSGSGKKAGKK